ncbi:MAG TPA: molecular chaperone DnaK [Coleofasciculaceae cyanobacterium]
MAKVIGIDLGMTNSRVAVIEKGKARVIANAEGLPGMPSVVSYTRSREHLIGQIAKRQALINDKNTIHSVKRFIGRKYDEVTEAGSRVAYEVLPANDGSILINCPNASAEFTPEEIAAQVLRQLANAASTYLGEEVTQAVITVPAYFTDAQRVATKDAGKLAGLEVLRIINEPTAACLAHKLDRRANETILVFDLGGESLNISVLEVGDGVFEILDTNSDFYLGGNDFDQKIVDWLIDEFQRQEKIDLRQDKQALQRLVEAAEKAKIELSSFSQAQINLPFITANQDGPLHLDITLTRTEFEEMCSDLLDRCRLSIELALQDAKLTRAEIDEVVLIGGSTYIPAVRELVRHFTGKEPLQGVNPEEAVVLGAAIQANVLSTEIYWGCGLLADTTSLSLGVETQHGLMTTLIHRDTIIPAKKSQIFSTQEDCQTSVEIHILRGERVLANDNKRVGTLRLDGLLLAPKGVPQIEVTFEIDGNGILSVTAKDLGTGKETSIVIPHAVTLDTEEVEQVINDAEIHAEADRKFLEPIQAREQLTSVVYDVERQLTELIEKLPDVDKDWVEGLVRNLRDVIEQQEGCDLNSKTALCDRRSVLTYKSQQALMPISNPVHTLVGVASRGTIAALCDSCD